MVGVRALRGCLMTSQLNNSRSIYAWICIHLVFLTNHEQKDVAFEHEAGRILGQVSCTWHLHGWRAALCFH